MSATILDVRPGYLNDFEVDDVDFDSIDFQSETPESILARMRDKVFSSNKFKTSGTLIGILLRDDGTNICTSTTVALNVVAPGSAKYQLNTYKIRVPELHFMLPVPNKLDPKLQSRRDKIIIDSYPTMQAIDTGVHLLGAVPGDLVKVEIGNKGALSRLYYAGPLDPKQAGMTKEEYEKCLEKCRKQYKNGGSVGDCIGKDENLVKFNNGVPPLTSGEGIAEDKLIPGPKHAKWLQGLLEGLHKEYFPGIIWHGALDGNGPSDNEAMIAGISGRSTLVYAPKAMDPKSNFELIYFFHDNLGFKNDVNYWKKLSKTLKTMAEKIKSGSLKGKRRNFIFVMPEMLWSEEDVSNKNTGFPRIQTQSDAFAGPRANRYKNRHWSVWGGNGASVGYSSLGPALGFSGGGPTDSTISGDMGKLHNEIKGILKDNFSAEAPKINFITLIGMGYGGIAISNIAREGGKNGLNNSGPFGKELKKIQYFHSDYSSTPDNAYHDNDLKEIIASIESDTQLEIHVGTGGSNQLPNNAASAFIGAISHVMVTVSQEQKSTPKEVFDGAKQYLANIYTAAGGAAGGMFKLNTQAGTPIPIKLQELHATGKNFINNHKTNDVRFAGPWANIIFKGRNGGPSFGWMTWISTSGEVPTAVATANAAPSKKEIFNAGSMENEKTNKSKYWKDFEGKIILFKSQAEVGGSGRAAIFMPPHADPTQPYELIYFLHGSGGSYLKQGWAPSPKKIIAALNTMTLNQKRNVIYVTMDLNVSNDIKTSTFAKVGSFEKFHQTALSHIKNTDKDGPGWKGTDPKFISLKAFSMGYASLTAVVKGMSEPIVAGTKLQRIDYLDATFVPLPVMKKVYTDWKGKITPGTDFEMHMYYSKKRKEKTYGPIKKYQKGPFANKFNGKEAYPGLVISEGGTSHYGVVTQNFSAPSFLAADKKAVLDPAKKKPPANSTSAPPPANQVPTSYDDDGNALNSAGKQISTEFPDVGTKYDLKNPKLKCIKGDAKKHRASTKKPKMDKACLTKCKEVLNKKFVFPGGEIECGDGSLGSAKNPLGLINYRGKFSKTRVHPSRQYSFGQKVVGNFIKKVLENPLWANVQGGQFWDIHDISPQWANGIDMVVGHNSHREGIGWDMNIPYRNEKGTRGGKAEAQGPFLTLAKNAKVYKKSPARFNKKNKQSGWVDYDRIIAMILLGFDAGKDAGLQPGYCRIFFGVRRNKGMSHGDCDFLSELLPRLQALQKQKTYKTVDPALQLLFKKHILGPALGASFSFGTLKPVKHDLYRTAFDVYNVFMSEKHHQHHMHVRLTTRAGSHQEGGGKFQMALKRLKKNGCTPPSVDNWAPHASSRGTWKKSFQTTSNLHEATKIYKGGLSKAAQENDKKF